MTIHAARLQKLLKTRAHLGRRAVEHHSKQNAYASSGFGLGFLTQTSNFNKPSTGFGNMVSCYSTITPNSEQTIVDDKLDSGSCNRLSRNTIADAAKVGPSVVRLRVDEGFGDTPILGSGFLVDSSGLIITCSHNIVTNRNPEAPKISDKHKVTVTLNGREFQGKTTCFDHVYDVAVVKIDDLADSDALSPAKLGISSQVQIGEFVFTLGYPQCFPRSLSSTLSIGIISSVSRTHSQARARGQHSLYIQTDCASPKGTSGSPLVNLNGEVVGVIIGGIPEAHRITFALPIETVRQRLSLKGLVV